MNDRHDRAYARNSSIDFKGIAAAALASAKSLLPEWLPGGRFESREYVALNPTRNDRALGSFKINWQTGEWADFAVPAKGRDLISLFAYINGLGPGQAARQIAERLGVSTYKSNGLNSHAKKSPPKICSWGEEGPAVGHDELRRHYYPKNGGPKLKVKIKRRNVPKHKEWLTCYRVIRDGTPAGWQWEKPKDYRDRPYFGTHRNDKLMFWPEGEKDADTLDRLGLPVFTFGGTGDGLPERAKFYLERLKGRLLVIVIDNDKSGSEHGHEKAKLAHAAGSLAFAFSIQRRRGRTAKRRLISRIGSLKAAARASSCLKLSRGWTTGNRRRRTPTSRRTPTIRRCPGNPPTAL